MDLKSVQRFANVLAKPFAGDILKLLANYASISSSEAASRLDLHIKTAQDFLEELTVLEITNKQQVYEKKRPYYRYKLLKYQFTIDVDLSSLADKAQHSDKRLDKKIRERQNNNAIFTMSRTRDFLSSVTIFVGKGRSKKQRKISLTRAQGTFLHHLPFPTAQPRAIGEIIKHAGIEKSNHLEIFDIVELLTDYHIIENYSDKK